MGLYDTGLLAEKLINFLITLFQRAAQKLIEYLCQLSCNAYLLPPIGTVKVTFTLYYIYLLFYQLASLCGIPVFKTM